MTALIIGANGKVGQRVCQKGGAMGIDLVGMVRDPGQVPYVIWLPWGVPCEQYPALRQHVQSQLQPVALPVPPCPFPPLPAP